MPDKNIKPVNHPVIILGVHRSGTSVVASVIEKMGVWCGETHELLAAQPDNKKGFWERIDVVSLNDEILNAAKLNWHSCSTGLKNQQITQLSEEFADPILAIIENLNRHPLWLLKDPRFSLTWPVWETFLATKPVFVSVFRHPYSVARSLHARNKIPMSLALRLWESHVIAIAKIIVNNSDQIILQYEQIIADHEAAFSKLNIALKNNIEEIKILSSQEINALFDTKLVHQKSGATKSKSLPERTMQIWDLIKNQEFRRVSEIKLTDCTPDNELVATWNELYENCLELQQLKSQHSESLNNIDKLLIDRALLEKEKNDAREIFEKTHEELNQFKSWGVQLKELNQSHEQKIQSLLSSTSWKITRPLRFISRHAKPVTKKAILKIITFSTGGLRKIYHSLPLKQGIKIRLKNAVFEKFPNLFSKFPTYATWELSRGHAQRESLIKTHPAIDDYPQIPGQTELAYLNEQLTQKLSAQPIVSIIIPVHGQLKYTYMCLDSICRISTEVPFELIIVDDKSADTTAEFLSDIKALTVITNKKNLGFINSCNLGAQAATGDYIVFLNNDTQIMAGWLDHLLATFKTIPDAGLVGSKLVYPDGWLQEAGGIIWNDGSAWNYGNGADPDEPEFNYLREVDYCSGASLMVERTFFNELGQFDQHYSPAYGEDSDLAFKVRAAGKKVYYQPASVVVHHEGISSGTDLTRGVKKYQLDNAKKLYQRWIDDIKLLERPGENIQKARDRGRIGRILVLDHCTPTPDMDAGSITALNFMRLLTALGYQVTFIPEDNFLYLSGYTEAMQKIGIEVIYAPYEKSVEQHLQKQGTRYDAVLLFRPLVAERHLQTIKQYNPEIKTLYHVSDLHFLRMERESQLEHSKIEPEQLEKSRCAELELIRQMDAIIVHSSIEEKILVSQYSVKNVHIFPWAIDIPGTDIGFNPRRDICFIGGYQHPPNVDAVLYFVKDIFPVLEKIRPGLKFYVIGSHPPDELKKLACERIVITGYIQDIIPELEKMRISIAPLRYGAGIKGKIGTTLSVGLPCVATNIAAEGMNLKNHKNVLIADAPEKFAQAIATLYEDEFLWNYMSRNGIEFANDVFGMKNGLKLVAEVIKSVGITNIENQLENPVIRAL